MSDSFTVFVCSTFDDLEQEREGVLDAIRRVQSRHNAMEFFGARPGRPIDVCLDEVRKSDLLVVIVGLKYGSLPAGMGISYSQAEYEEGVRLEKPCLVYLRDDDVPILPKYVERDSDKLRLLEAWKDTLNANRTVAKFESWPKLAVQVAADIGNVLLVRATAAAKGVADRQLERLGNRYSPGSDLARRLVDDCQGEFDAARAALNAAAKLPAPCAGGGSNGGRISRPKRRVWTGCNSTTTPRQVRGQGLDPDNFLAMDLGDLCEI